MERSKWPEGYKPKQIGVKIDPALWKELRMVALEQDRTATELLEEAIREYIDRHRDNPVGSGDGWTPPLEKGGTPTAAMMKSVKTGERRRRNEE